MTPGPALGAGLGRLLHDAAMSAPEEAAPPAEETAEQTAEQAVEETAEQTGGGNAAKPAKPALSGSHKRHLRALAHHLDPVVRIGKEGMTPAVVSATNDALRTHELIKVRLPQAGRAERTEMAEALRRRTDAHLAGLSGRVALLYRRHPETPRIRLPR